MRKKFYRINLNDEKNLGLSAEGAQVYIIYICESVKLQHVSHSISPNLLNVLNSYGIIGTGTLGNHNQASAPSKYSKYPNIPIPQYPTKSILTSLFTSLFTLTKVDLKPAMIYLRQATGIFVKRG